MISWGGEKDKMRLSQANAREVRDNLEFRAKTQRNRALAKKRGGGKV